ncbi:hypothetical protein BDP27DRAFT_1479476 [Rhodocollybia butyracea]|uniref:Uncharacterized protein n=1 Tax=Rhodocollybia butyracea TaxID=206335 RepID=A0A9P5U1V2_9AGAR|nr:hypothetical protein BDP27DRAFT_1479476 [Rhodocollybia butyracea]
MHESWWYMDAMLAQKTRLFFCANITMYHRLVTVYRYPSSMLLWKLIAPATFLIMVADRKDLLDTLLFSGSIVKLVRRDWIRELNSPVEGEIPLAFRISDGKDRAVQDTHMTRKQSLPPSSVSEDRMERPIPSVTAQSRCNAPLGYNPGERGVRDGWNDVGEVGGTNTRNIREWGNNSSKPKGQVNINVTSGVLATARAASTTTTDVVMRSDRVPSWSRRTSLRRLQLLPSYTAAATPAVNTNSDSSGSAATSNNASGFSPTHGTQFTAGPCSVKNECLSGCCVCVLEALQRHVVKLTAQLTALVELSFPIWMREENCSTN